MNRTIASLLSVGTDSVRAISGSEREAQRNAELLLAHVCGYESIALMLLDRERIIPKELRHRYFVLVKRRNTGEPLQYITEEVDFMDCTLRVTPSCLIPRPETEELVEHVLFWAHKQQRPLRILDIGTGSGNIAIALAKAIATCSIDAVDISNAALMIAKENAQCNHVAHKISFFISNIFETIRADMQYDIIVSNPPYLRTDEYELVAPELTWEPHTALVSGPSGLEVLQKLTHDARTYLGDGGILFLEIGESQGASMEQYAKDCHYSRVSCIHDLAGHDRCIMAEK